MHKLLKQAFTLIELLVVIAIIGILSGLVIVGINGMVQKATIAKNQMFSNSLRNALLRNIISEWKFDGATINGNPASTNDVLDTWSGMNNGSVSYPPTVKTGSDCVSGSCLFFDGDNDFVDFGSDPSLSMRTGDQTLSFWVNFDNAIAPQHETLFICGADATGRAGYWIRRSNQTRLQFDFSDGTSSPITGFLSAEDFLMNNIWYYMVVVFDRDSVAQVYINGVPQAESVNISSQQGDVQNYSSLKIGAFSSSMHRFEGRIDEVRIYNTILPVSKILEQYYAGLKRRR